MGGSENKLTARLVTELYCSDINISKAFYIDILGFKICYERPDEGFVYLERQGAELMLDQIEKTRTWLKGELVHPYGRGVNFQIQTDNVDVLYANVQQAGCEIFLELEEKWYRCDDVHNGNRQFIICDPDGYLLRFFEDLGERSDV